MYPHINHSNEHGNIEAICVNGFKDHWHLYGAIGETSDFNDELVNRLSYCLDDDFKRIGMITRLFVDKESRGKGYGKDLMDKFMKNVVPKTDIDFLLARIEIPQESGFCLESFYRGYGFEPVCANSGDMLMVNKGHAGTIREALGLEPLPEFHQRPRLNAVGTFWKPTVPFINELAGFLKGKNVLEVFSGNGLLCHELRKAGVNNITPTSLLSGMDGHEYNLFIEDTVQLSASSAVAKYGNQNDVLLVSWPTTTMDMLYAAELWGPDKDIVFIGEITDLSLGSMGLGGCATDEFWERVDKVMEFEHYSTTNMLEKAAVLRMKNK